MFVATVAAADAVAAAVLAGHVHPALERRTRFFFNF